MFVPQHNWTFKMSDALTAVVWGCAELSVMEGHISEGGLNWGITAFKFHHRISV